MKLNILKFAKAQLLTRKSILSLSSTVIAILMCISSKRENTCGGG